MGTTAFCTSCGRTLYLEDDASPACPVCSSPVLLTSMPEKQAGRIGHNESMYRDVNERIKSVSDDEPSRNDKLDFICECGSDECTEIVRLTQAEYESVRSRQSWFAVLPGHEIPEVEVVVKRTDGYFVVEKQGAARHAAGA